MIRRFFLFYLLLLAFVGFFLGTAIYTRQNPLKWDDTFHYPSEIQVLELTPEKVTFRWGLWNFYLEGDATTVGSMGDKAFVYHSKAGTYCILSKDPEQGMEVLSTEANECFIEAHDAGRRLTDRWFALSGQTSMRTTPTWSSR